MNSCLKTQTLVSRLIIVIGWQGASNHVQSVIDFLLYLSSNTMSLYTNIIHIKQSARGLVLPYGFPGFIAEENWFSVSIICDQYLEFSIVPRDQLVCIKPVSILVDVWLPCLCIIDPPWYPIHYPKICVDLIITQLWCDSVIVYYQLVFELFVINLLNVTIPFLYSLRSVTFAWTSVISVNFHDCRFKAEEVWFEWFWLIQSSSSDQFLTQLLKGIYLILVSWRAILNLFACYSSINLDFSIVLFIALELNWSILGLCYNMTVCKHRNIIIY